MERPRRDAARTGAQIARASIGCACAIALCWLAATPPAAALSIDFEDVETGSDTARVDFPRVNIGGALVLDEATIALLTLHSGQNWAVSGDRGAFNSLDGSISFDFDVPARSFGVQVLALPGAGGGPVSVLLEAFFGEMLVLSTSSTPDRLGDSGLHEDALAIADLGPGYTRIVLTPMADGVPLGRDALWIDDAVFEPVPEPGTALLVGLSLAAIAAQRRAGSCAAQRRAGS